MPSEPTMDRKLAMSGAMEPSPASARLIAQIRTLSEASAISPGWTMASATGG
ncbi:hypothetical protein Strvi_6226 [Streptomyces violaceusniger Tu 4113]|uniref:Uncharacterized protein n=2 Tax=Streptomyces violaceusniger TaxID=68280 RepID=G2NVF1_STRV4|nr:hypothetical protein Strvi_6226 [Streptomyces violaceusniger Tu 4113]